MSHGKETAMITETCNTKVDDLGTTRGLTEGALSGRPRQIGLGTRNLALSLLFFGLISGPAAAQQDRGEFAAKPIGAGTYGGHQGKVKIEVGEGEKREIVTVVGDMPIGSNVGYHYHPGHALVIVTQGKVASFDSAECAARTEYEAGDAFLDFPGHVHDIVNVGDEPAQFVVTFLLDEGEQPLQVVDDPGAENCQNGNGGAGHR
jgi:quercetin dioxygenase-like cupin family protein